MEKAKVVLFPGVSVEIGDGTRRLLPLVVRHEPEPFAFTGPEVALNVRFAYRTVRPE